MDRKERLSDSVENANKNIRISSTESQLTSSGSSRLSSYLTATDGTSLVHETAQLPEKYSSIDNIQDVTQDAALASNEDGVLDVVEKHRSFPSACLNVSVHNPPSDVDYGMLLPPNDSCRSSTEEDVLKSVELSTELDSSLRCGICGWRPQCMNRLANIRVFLAAACFISCLQAAFSGYVSSQVTTIEKRFAIGSSIIGMINSFFEIGYIFSVMYVSYAGSRGRVPLWVASGLFAMAAGAFLWSLPHFLQLNRGEIHSIVLTEQLCLPHQNTTCTDSETCHPVERTKCPDGGSSGYAFLPILLAAQLLIGAGSSPILTLTPPFIDDHVHPSKAPPMIASQYAAAAMGPVLGFALGATLLQYPADIFASYVPTPDDPNWIGAWWAGFILLGLLVLIGGFILLMFPRRLREITISNKARFDPPVLRNGSVLTSSAQAQTLDLNTTLTTTQMDSENSPNSKGPWSEMDGRTSRRRRNPYSCSPHFRCRIFDASSTWQRFVLVLRSLVRNKVYIVVCLCIGSEMFLIIGFASFLPKYLETEYHLEKSTTSAIAGGLIVPSGALGILVGGLILNRFRFHRRGRTEQNHDSAAAIRFVLFINVIILICVSSFFFLGCVNPPIVGLTHSHPTIIEENNQSHYPISLFAACNSHCSCDSNLWSPVCHKSSGISFISPCLAGCADRSTPDQSSHEIFHNCSCVPTSPADTLQPPSLHNGRCHISCPTLIPFICILTLCLFLTGVIQNPLLMVTMRSVNHNERSFALGLQFVIIRIVANLPSPIVFGRVIDGACRMWRYSCNRRGDCAFSDVRYLNWYMTGLGMVIKGSGFIFYFLLLYLLRLISRNKTNDPGAGSDPMHIECEPPTSESPKIITSPN